MAHVVRRPRLVSLPLHRRRRDPRSRVRPRSFAAAYVVLCLLVGGAAAAAYLLSTSESSRVTKPTTLTPAQTTGLGDYSLKAIAFDVQQAYRRKNGSPLVAVVARPANPPQFMTASGPVAISAMIVHTGLAIEDPRDVKSFDVSKSALFVLCGASVGCAIPGPPSTGRAAMLDREVIALALRTLDHLQSVDAVLTFLPPSSAKRVVYLTRGDLTQRLSEPLPHALRGGRTVTTLVRAHTFAVSSISLLPDGSAYLAAEPAG